MRFYNATPAFYAGSDRHARRMLFATVQDIFRDFLSQPGNRAEEEGVKDQNPKKKNKLVVRKRNFTRFAARQSRSPTCFASSKLPLCWRSCALDV